MSLLSEWTSFCVQMALTENDYMSGVQKILHGQVWRISREDFFDDETVMSDFGYSETSGAKLKALKRHYYDREKTRAARNVVKNKWEQRTYGSAGFPLIGEVKKWTKQDFCMQACTATHYPRGGVRICVFYRTTEIIKKFGADLIFLRDVVLPRFDRIKSIHEITFMFSNITVHPMFFPTLLAHHPAPVSFLEAVRIEDERFHTGICKWMTKYLLEGETSWVQKFSQAKQTHKAMLRLMDKSTQRQLKSYFREHKK